MLNSLRALPTPDELELSIFGPGYGESVAVHLGNGQWVLVDCCLDPETGRPAPLEYLRHLNVDVARSVRLIVATHWHDDHVRGISTLLDECKSAKFAISGALNSCDFLKLVTLYSKQVAIKSSGLDEFVRVFQILDERKQQGVSLNSPILAISDKHLHCSKVLPSTEANVFSLSPSDASVLQAQLAFAELLPKETEQRKRIRSLTPNHASVVLWIQVGDHRLLLGADLERTNDPKTGWSAILDESIVVSGKASVFKVAHHGALSAHEPRIWRDLLSNAPIAVISPFSNGDKLLPNKADVRRINDLTPNAYITSQANHKRHKWANKVVKEFVQDATRNIRDIHAGWGQIRIRRKITEKNDTPQVALFGDALALNTLLSRR